MREGLATQEECARSSWVSVILRDTNPDFSPDRLRVIFGKMPSIELKSFVFSGTLPSVAFCLTRQNEFASEGWPLPRPHIRPMQEVLKNSAETEGVVKCGLENGGTTIVANAMPNTCEVFPCQEINYLYERFFSFPKKLPLRHPPPSAHIRTL
jgi:hypothetical protein